MNGSIVEQKDGYTVEHVVHTYSEEENQQMKIDKQNAKLPFNIKYLNIQMERLDVLTINEALVYAFIDLFLAGTADKFYAGDESIGKTLRMSTGTVSRSIKKLSKLGLINKRNVRKGARTKRYITIKSGSPNWRSLGRQFGGLYTNPGDTNNYTSILNLENSVRSNLFYKLKHDYGLDKQYIEEAFQKKKTLSTIEQVCKYIKELSAEIGLAPIYDKRTINCFHIISKHYTVEELTYKLVEFDYIDYKGNLAYYIDTLNDIVEADYYLPVVLGLMNSV